MMEWQEIPTAAGYIEFRQKTRPFGVTLREFSENYPNEHLLDEWRQMLPEMFRSAEEAVGVPVIQSIEKNCEGAMQFLRQMHKFYPEKLPEDWWKYLKCWQSMQADRNIA